MTLHRPDSVSVGPTPGSAAIVLSSAPRADHTGLEKLLHSAGFAVSFRDQLDATDAMERPPGLVIVDVRATVPGTIDFLNRLSQREPVPQTVFWGTGPTRVGVVEFDQTVRLNWLSSAWHFDTLQQLETRLRTRERPKVAVTAGELKSALDAGALELRYQPTLDLRRTDSPSPVEALLRWRHPSLGLLTASEFMPVATDPQLRRQLTDYALQVAVRQLNGWQLAGLGTSVVVNLDASLLNDVQFPRRLSRLVEQHDVDPSRLGLEVNEHGVMTASAETIATMDALVERGFRLCVDDFGGTHISLQQVLLLPFSQLKISAALVRGLSGAERARRLVRGVIHLAHDLEMTACGKGVETSEQMLLLKGLGCDAAQGWYIGGPIEAAELANILAGSGNVGETVAQAVE